MQYALVCYPPAEVQIAEQRFAACPLDPSKVVSRITGLPLSLVTDARHILPTPMRRVTLLEFDFGPVPQGIPPPTPGPASAWVSVTEYARPFIRDKRVRLSPAEIPGATWQLNEQLWRHRHIAVLILTDGPKTQIASLGRALVRADRRGPGCV